MAQLKAMTLEQLVELETQLREDAVQLRDARRALAAELGLRRAKQSLYDKVAAMSDEEKEATLQLLQAGSIESGEQFGNLGE